MLLLSSFTFVLDRPPSFLRLSLTRKGEASNYYPCALILLVYFSFSVSQLCYLYVCSIISTQKLQITSTPPEDHRRRESHSTLAYTTLCTFTPLFVLFTIQCLCQFGSRSPSPHQNMSHKTEHVGHWEDLETWLSVATVSLLPKAAETLKHQTQDQLDDNITGIMGQDPSQSYSHKELTKITGSLSHTLIATLKLSDKHAAQRQQEQTSAQRRIEQLEREAQERQEGTDEVEQGAEEEINRLKETLAATSHEMEQIKEDFDQVRSRLSGCPGDETRTSRTSSSLLESTQTSILWNSQ